MKLHEMIDSITKLQETEIPGEMSDETIHVKYEDGRVYISEKFIPLSSVLQLNAFLYGLLQDFAEIDDQPCKTCGSDGCGKWQCVK